MSATISETQLVISSGVSSSGLAIGANGEVDVMDGGILTDSIVSTHTGMIYVEAGGFVQKISASDYGDIWVEGSAADLTAENSAQFDIYTGGKLTGGTLLNGGYGAVYPTATATDVAVSSGGVFLLYGGSADKTNVLDGGNFVLEETIANATNTTILAGGSMLVNKGAGVQNTTVSGGEFELRLGTADATVLDGGILRVTEGNTIRNTTVNDGTFYLSGASAETVVVTGGNVNALSSSTLTDVTLNGGKLTDKTGTLENVTVNTGAILSVSGDTVRSATVNDGLFEADAAELYETKIEGGTATFTGVSVNGISLGSAGVMTLDAESILIGKAVFAEGATVEVDGTTVAFDTEVATTTETQIQGFSAISGTAVYTLTAGVDIGVYLLAEGADDFDGDVLFGDYTLRLGEEPTRVEDLVYSLNLDAGTLQLVIAEYVEPIPGVVSLAYVNSEWANLTEGTEVNVGGVTAVIGTDAFANGDDATAAVADVEGGKVRVAGGTVTFESGISKNTAVYNGAEITNSDVAATGQLTVNKGAFLTGKAAFAEGSSVTINGTVVFDIACASSNAAQYTFNGVPGGKASFSLNVETPKAGTYLLVDGLSTFEAPVSFGDYMLTVGADPVTIDGMDYTLSFGEDKILTLGIAYHIKPDDTVPPTVSNVTASITTPTNQDVTVTAEFDDDIELAFALYKLGEEGEWTAYPANGVVLTENGTVFFKAIDAAGNESEVVAFTVSNIDKVPPEQPAVSADITAPTNQDVTVTAIFSDDSVTMEYSFNGTDWTAYVAPIDFTENGTVYFRGTDAAGNISEITGYTVSNIDKTIPVVPDTVPPTVSNVTANITVPTNQDVTVTAEFADDVKLASSLFKIGEDGEWTAYPLKGVVLTENGTVYFKAVDKAGNESEVIAFTVSNIDRTPPEQPMVSADITAPTNQDVTVTAIFSDDSVTMEYSFNGTEWTAYVAPIDFTENGTVYFRGTDAAGNVSEITGYTVSNIDKTIPVVPDTVPPTVSNVKANITVLTNQDVTVTAEFADDVKLASSLFRIGEEGEWTAYPLKGVVLTENGTVYFKAVDKAGNESEVVALTVSNIDKIPPEQPTASADITEPTDQDVTVTAVFSEDSVTKEYSFNGTDWTAYDTPIVFSENGTVYFRGLDAAGNISEIAGYTVSNIEKAPPDTEAPTLSFIKADIPNTKPTNKDVTVTVLFEDNVGVVSTQFKLGDEGEWTVYPADGVVLTENGPIYFKAADEAGNESEIAGYTVSNIDKSLPDGQPQVYVNTEWAELASGTIVETFDGSTAAVGVNAFATGDEANAAVDWTGFVYLENGTISFTSAAHNVVVHDEAGLLIDNEAGIDSVWVYDRGIVSMTKGVMTNCKVLVYGGKMTVESGAVVDGLTVDAPDELSVEVNGATVKNLLIGCLQSVLDMEYNCFMSVAGEDALLQGASVTGGGNLYVSSGAHAENVSVTGGGKLSVSSGVLIDGLTVSGYEGWENNVVIDGSTVNDLVMTGFLLENSAYYCGAVVTGEDGLVRGATVTSGGRLFVSSGAYAENVTLAGEMQNGLTGDLNVTDGGTVSGVTVSSGGSLGGNCDAVINDVQILEGGIAYMEETTGSKAVVNDIMYVGRLASFRDIRIGSGGSVSTLNSAGIGSVFDTEVQSGGFLYNDGYASNTQVQDGGSMTITPRGLAEDTTVRSGGILEISGYRSSSTEFPIEEYGIAADITIENGAIVNVQDFGELSGQVTIVEGATVTMTENAVLDFDISGRTGAEETPLVSGYSFIDGTPNLTLSVSANQLPGDYLLIDGLTEFDRGIAFGGYTLTAGGEPVTVDGVIYSLNLVEKLATEENPDPGSSLVLTVFIPLSVTYVNSEWETATEPTVTFVDVTGETVTATLGIDAYTTGDEAVAKTAADGEVQVVGGTVSFGAVIDRDIVIDKDATLVGKAAVTDGVTITVNGSAAFDTAYATATDAQFGSIVAQEDSEFTLTIGEGHAQADASFLLATGAESLSGHQVVFGDFTYTVGATDFFVDGDNLSYLLDLADGDFVLSFVNLVNGADDGTNNWLFDKKNKEKPVNPAAETFVSTALAEGVTDVLLDKRGTIKSTSGEKTYYNFVNSKDYADYAKITLDKGARLSFNIEAEHAAKFVIYSIETGVDKNDKPTYKLKQLQSTSLKQDKTTKLYTATTNNLLLDRTTENVEYYIAMESTDKNADKSFYNVAINSDETGKNFSVFYADGDDGTNNWLYNKKDKENPVNPDVYGSDPFVINRETNHVQVDAQNTVYVVDEHGFTWENFVGFGDDTDFVRINLDTPSKLSFDVQATGAAKFTIYCLETGLDKDGNTTYTLKQLQSTSLKKQKFEIEGDEEETFEMYVASTKSLLLDLPADNQEYFISVQSSNAKKGDKAYYTVTLGEIGKVSDFYADADSGWNNYVYDKKLGYNAENIDKFVTTEIAAPGAHVMLELDSTPVSEEWDNFVGFGDAADYAKITVAADTTLSFSLKASDAAKFTIWALETGEKKGETTYKMKSLQATALKKDGNTGLYTKDTKEYTFKEGGTYFISMEASNAKKGSFTYYDVEVKSVVLSGGNTASLDMPELSGATDGLNAGLYADASAVDLASGSDQFASLDETSLLSNTGLLA